MNPSVRDLLRIVWKDKIDSPVKIFRLTTVTYGTKSAPYLATRSLKQLAIDDGDKYPLAAEVIMSDVYMDDLLTGADDLESGRKLQVQLVSYSINPSSTNPRNSLKRTFFFFWQQARWTKGFAEYRLIELSSRPMLWDTNFL
ncbi:uncharacterized protein TNCV_4931981 [Trichonephila clavipes]|nr:uncharacterized protein TNCV_4931981 [Trichonephila clavipes]